MTIYNFTRNLGSLTDEHVDLCLGLKTLLESGVPADELALVLERLCDQAEGIQIQCRNAIKPTASESEAQLNMNQH